MSRSVLAVALVLASGLSIQAQTPPPSKDHKIQVQEVKITGIRSISSIELDEITGALTAKPINEDEQEIEDRLRFAFQDHGYLRPEVGSVRVKPIDALARPKLVVVEAVVTEGPRFKMGEIRFSGNHAIDSEQLKANFPFHKDELFNRSRLGKGLDSLRVAYSKLGYLDVTPIPNVSIAADSVDLNTEIDEGTQYHMGTLEFGGNADAAEKLRARWELEAGQPFDETYIQKFVDENRSLFPADFDLQSSLKYGRDCKNAKVNLLFDLDPEHPSKPPEDVLCDKKKSEGDAK